MKYSYTLSRNNVKCTTDIVHCILYLTLVSITRDKECYTLLKLYPLLSVKLYIGAIEHRLSDVSPYLLSLESFDQYIVQHKANMVLCSTFRDACLESSLLLHSIHSGLKILDPEGEFYSISMSYVKTMFAIDGPEPMSKHTIVHVQMREYQDTITISFHFKSIIVV